MIFVLFAVQFHTTSNDFRIVQIYSQTSPYRQYSTFEKQNIDMVCSEAPKRRELEDNPPSYISSPKFIHLFQVPGKFTVLMFFLNEVGTWGEHGKRDKRNRNETRAGIITRRFSANLCGSGCGQFSNIAQAITWNFEIKLYVF